VLKPRIYAKAGIPWYWVVDLTGRQMHVFSRPFGDRYLDHSVLSVGDMVSVTLDGQSAGTVPVSDLLP
jgi:Uma2 family endonuclease